MLMSQRIAQDLTFLNINHKQTIDTFNLRLAIMAAPKFIVSLEHIALGQTLQETLGRMNIGKTEAKLKERIKRWVDYARLPYQSIFIENQSGGLFVQKLPDGTGFLAYCIGTEGGILPLIPKIKFVYLGEEATFQIAFDYVNKEASLRFKEHEENPSSPKGKDSWYEKTKNLTEALLIQICEILVFLNAANTRVHHYVPTRKEMGKVPKNQVPHYTYRILDVFRERDRYVSIGDIENGLEDIAKNSATRRAHLVRGHFKTFKRDGKVKLFWWNDFTRCRKNAKETGIVEKDYRLHIEETIE